MSQIKAPKGATHKAIGEDGRVVYWLNTKTGEVWTGSGSLITTSSRYKGAPGVQSLEDAGGYPVVRYTFQLENK